MGASHVFPLFFTQLYSVCLKEGCNDVSKYRPISLINIGGKLLEKLMIDRILFHINTNNLFNDNKYGLTLKEEQLMQQWWLKMLYKKAKD